MLGVEPVCPDLAQAHPDSLSLPFWTRDTKNEVRKRELRECHSLQSLLLHPSRPTSTPAPLRGNLQEWGDGSSPGDQQPSSGSRAGGCCHQQISPVVKQLIVLLLCAIVFTIMNNNSWTKCRRWNHELNVPLQKGWSTSAVMEQEPFLPKALWLQGYKYAFHELTQKAGWYYLKL